MCDEYGWSNLGSCLDINWSCELLTLALRGVEEDTYETPRADFLYLLASMGQIDRHTKEWSRERTGKISNVAIEGNRMNGIQEYG